jgi:ribosomal protein S12 methylthiotransferase accessory factor
MEITVKFPGNRRVDAELRGLTISTDQPEKAGGDNSAPTPFEHFLASIATCSGIYVLDFCRNRGIPLDNVRLIEKVVRNPETHMVTDVTISIEVPADFPDKYRDSLIRAVDLCTVKKHLFAPPRFMIEVVKAG